MPDIAPIPPTPAWHALLFEAQSIQPYLFATNRLRDAVGGSELLDALTNEDTSGNLLDAVLHATDPGQVLRFSRRAGGAFYAFSQDLPLLKRFANLWVSALRRWAPELDYALALESGQTVRAAFDNARDALRGRQPQPALPLAAPVAQRAPRTGLAASASDKKDGAIDAATQRKKAFANPATAGFIKRFNPHSANLCWRDWPIDLNPEETQEQDSTGSSASADSPRSKAFPFLKDGLRIVAIIHGDGNGMGQALRTLAQTEKDGEDYISLFRRFSEALQSSAIAAAKAATEHVLLSARADGECLPARPLILGGDDLLIIVRADLALAYVQRFAAAFEEQSAEQLRKLQVPGLPAGMSMGFGVAYVSADQPFALAAQMAEELMRRAKTQAKQRVQQRQRQTAAAQEPAAKKAASEECLVAPSTVQFHRITAALWNDAGAQIDAETQFQDNDGKTYVHTLGCYALDSKKAEEFDLPALDHLLQLQRVLSDRAISHGAMRGLLNAIETNATQAREDSKRWREVMGKRASHVLQDFDKALEPLLHSVSAGKDLDPLLPYAKRPAPAEATDDAQSIWCSPLGDALTLRAVGNRIANPESAA